MANIQPEINDFKSAVYGEEVRDALISLANKLNNESSSSASTVAEYDARLTDAETAANTALQKITNYIGLKDSIWYAPGFRHGFRIERNDNSEEGIYFYPNFARAGNTGIKHMPLGVNSKLNSANHEWNTLINTLLDSEYAEYVVDIPSGYYRYSDNLNKCIFVPTSHCLIYDTFMVTPSTYNKYKIIPISDYDSTIHNLIIAAMGVKAFGPAADMEARDIPDERWHRWYIGLTGTFVFKNPVNNPNEIAWRISDGSNLVLKKSANSSVADMPAIETFTMDRIISDIKESAPNYIVEIDGLEYVEIPQGHTLCYDHIARKFINTEATFYQHSFASKTSVELLFVFERGRQIRMSDLGYRFATDYDNWLENKSGVANSGILALNPDIKSKITQLKGQFNKTTNQRLELPKILTLLHFSDPHNMGNNNYPRLMSFISAFEDDLDGVICTGDIAKTRFVDGIANHNTYAYNGVMNVVGNHDSTAVAAGETLSWKNVVPQNTLYERYIMPYYSTWGDDLTIVEGHTYWYKDYPGHGIRLIGADSNIWDSTEVNAHITWLKNVLASAKESNLTVVIGVHHPPVKFTPITCNFTSRIKSDIAYIGSNYPWYTTYTQYMDAVQEFIDGGGKFACWLCGHTHVDLIVYPTDYPDQLVLTVTTSQVEIKYEDCIRQVGDKSQDAFNIVGIDSFKEIVKIARVGQDRDYYMNHMGTLVLDYSTSPATVLYQD